MKTYGITDTGLVRSMNQDTYETVVFSDSLLFACVCDGMGGPGGGEIASSLASKMFTERLKDNIVPGCSLTQLARDVNDILIEINEKIQETAAEDDLHSGMGTTFAAAVVVGKKALVVNIGDSRVYHITRNTIKQVTKDHSMVQQLLDDGKITREEFKSHPNKNIITKALGAFDSVEPDYYEVQLRDDSMLILCSDGLTNYVDDNEILFELTNEKDMNHALKQLVDIAYKRGAADNITIVVLANE